MYTKESVHKLSAVHQWVNECLYQLNCFYILFLTAALFFFTYESIKHFSIPVVPTAAVPLVYMVGASISEVVACLIRVPIEVVKQRRQTSHGSKQTSLKILLKAYKTEGFRKVRINRVIYMEITLLFLQGLYRGFGSTIIREIPFSLIQFPILEYLKTGYRSYFKNNIPLESWEVAICGAIAGNQFRFHKIKVPF